MAVRDLSRAILSSGTTDTRLRETLRRRWVVVVWPDRAPLLARLSPAFGQSAWVEVLVDRRHADRRQERRTHGDEQRLVDRRSAVVTGGTPNYRVAYRGDGFDVYEATSFVSMPCGECGIPGVFEMPRFGEPPARLDLQVIHEAAEPKPQPGRARHLVEIQSLGATGRPLLAARHLARTRSPWAEPSV